MRYLSGSNAKLRGALIRLLRDDWPRDSESAESPTIQKLITTLMSNLISNAVVVLRSSSRISSDPLPDYVQTAKKFLSFCIETDNTQAVPELFQRLKDPKNSPAHFFDVALPFLNVLRQTLESYDLDISHEPYCNFCRDLIVTVIDKWLGPEPAAHSSVICEKFNILGCDCKSCADMKKSVSSERDMVTIWRPEKVLKHLQKEINTMERYLGLFCHFVHAGGKPGLRVSSYHLDSA